MWWAFALWRASAEFSGQGLALPLEESLTLPEESEDAWANGPVCSWAQEILVKQCNSQHPDTPTGCAAGIIEGKPSAEHPQRIEDTP